MLWNYLTLFGEYKGDEHFSSLFAKEQCLNNKQVIPVTVLSANSTACYQ